MWKFIQFAGFSGILVGICVFCALWLVLWKTRKGTEFAFDANGEKGAFGPLLSNYLDIAKLVLGLASGSIVLLVGSSALNSEHRLLPASFASPLFLLALSILYGILFMALIVIDYESYRHKTKPYTRCKYSLNMALGFSSLTCFFVGYMWLIVIVTKQP